MDIPYQKFREIVFQYLYSQDMGKADPEELVLLLSTQLSVSKNSVKLAESKARLILARLDELDNLIQKASLSYAFERIQSVERNLLRLATYELIHDSNIPPKVAISEAIRLARKFATPESARFVNAVLDNIFQQMKGDETDDAELNQAIQELTDSEKELS